MLFRSGETGSADVGDAMAARFGRIFLQRFGVAQRIEFLAEDGHGAGGAALDVGLFQLRTSPGFGSFGLARVFGELKRP